MRERIKGAVIVVLYATLMLIAPRYVYSVLAFLLGVLMVGEVLSFTRLSEYLLPITVLFSILFAISVNVSFYLWLIPLFFLSIFSYFLLVEEGLPKNFLEVAAFLLYILSGTVAIAVMDRKLFLLLIAVVWSVDTFAYLTGKFFGRRKLVPSVSPKKTVEGAIGGTLGGVLVSSAVASCLRVFSANLPSLLILTLICVVAQFGDIFESYFKRMFNVKDSGKIIPGHGGVLDRLDSSLAVAPILLLIGS